MSTVSAHQRMFCCFVICLSVCVGKSWGQASPAAIDSTKRQTNPSSYDPLRIDEDKKIETLLLEFEYRPEVKSIRNNTPSEEARKIPLKVYYSETTSAPVVLFSHGLGGSREGFKHGGEHWAKRGYIAVFMQHPGSDESVWRTQKLAQRMTAMREAANGQNLMLRIEDVKAVIDFLERVQKADAQVPAEAKRLKSMMDLGRVGMSGHSFGAVTTQMVSGQSPVLPTQHPTDSRIRAAIVLSPSPPRIGQPERYFNKVSIPWLLMTGTKDDSPIGDQTAASRLQVFPALPVGRKYQVVFEGGTHAFLGERMNFISSSGESSTHARATVALSTAFWDTYLKEDPKAKQWIDGDGPRSILAPQDQWQTK